MVKYFIFFIFLFEAGFGVDFKTFGNDPNLPTVAIIMAGGTIVQKVDPKTGASVPQSNGEELLMSPELLKIANIKIGEFSNIDSSQMTPAIWLSLSDVVDEVLQDPTIKGAVITHGTDTMTEAAYFLDLTLKTNKPVAMTGAMRSASDPYSDGPFNLLNAIVQVVSDNAKDWGVTVTMNQYINSSRIVEKTQTTNVQSFQSGEKGYLGYIFNYEVFRFNDRLYRIRLPLPKVLPRVDLVQDFAGSDGSFIMHAIERGAKGIVVESFGAGNVNLPVFEAIEKAIDKGIFVVITTSVPYGSVFPVYGVKGGGKSLQDIGACVCGNISAAKSRILLMLALSQKADDRVKLQGYFDIP